MLLGFLGLCLIIGGVAGWLSVGPSLVWYASQAHPPFSPPNWLFGPAWTILYCAMAVAAWLIWREPSRAMLRRGALTLWGLQLALNATWTPVFFGLHLVLLGLAVLVALVVTVAVTAQRFYRLEHTAGLLMVPYLAWVCFATYLNAGFWWLNR